MLVFDLRCDSEVKAVSITFMYTQSIGETMTSILNKKKKKKSDQGRWILKIFKRQKQVMEKQENI